YSTIKTRASRMMPRRTGLTRKGSQVRQRRHFPRSALPGLAGSSPVPRPAFAGSVRITNVLPGRRARTLPHEQPGLSCRRTGLVRAPPAQPFGGGGVGADAAATARTMWTLFEPVHAVTYFTADSRSAYEQAGLRGFWRGYFAGRAAPLGAVSAPVV